MSKRSELRAAAERREGGRCLWPACFDPGAELAHLHSIGVGGRKSPDTFDDVAFLCGDHALMSDGVMPAGGANQYLRAHLLLFGSRFLDMPANVVGYERAEALRELIG